MKNRVMPAALMVLAMGALLCLLGSCKSAGNKAADLNVLLITLDTTRADHIGAYGHISIKTPHIDELCRKGVMLQNCYSPVPLTLPAHCSIFTGKYSIGHGVRNNGRYYLTKNETTLTGLLKNKGYHTQAVIASFVLLARFGLNQGFDIYDDSIDTHEKTISFKSEIPADAVYRRFKNWFAANSQKKFFSWVHFYDPHQPYQPPAEYIEKGREDNELKRYAGEIEFVDKYVGEIIADLKAAGILDKTLIVIAGDHGEAFGEHLEYGHSIFCYEENLKVPLIFYNETILEKKTIEDPAGLVDIMPTILDLLGIQIPADVQGTSILPLMRGEKRKNTPTFFIESIYGKEEMNWAPLTGIIAGNYKYISLPEPELYNLETDARETDNIFKKEFKTAKELDSRLKEMIIKLSGSGSTGKAKRDLTGEDIRHLKSLGYVSAFSSKDGEGAPLDPKQGVIIDNKMKDFAEQIEKGENLDTIERELKAAAYDKNTLKTPITFTLLYNIYKKKRDLSAAITILEAGMREFPDFYQFRYTLATFLFELKKYAETIAHCRFILKDNPVFAEAYTLMGEVYFQQGNHEEAIRNYREAVKLEPENILLKTKYADILINLQRYDEAAAIYNSLLDKEGIANNHLFLYKVAMFNARYGRTDTAERIFQRLVQLKPDGKYYFYYALLLFKNRKPEQALQNMEIAVARYSVDLTAEQQKRAADALKAWRGRF